MMNDAMNQKSLDRVARAGRRPGRFARGVAPLLNSHGQTVQSHGLPVPHEKHRFSILISCLFLLTLLLVSCNDHTRATSEPQTQSVTAPVTQRVIINGLKFDLELALTPEQRHRGLSDRASISEKGGMLFVFPRPETVGFVMRRCLVPIDIAFLTEEGKVAAMYEMKVEPYDMEDGELPSYPSHQPILFALEFKGGTLARIGLKRGDTVDLPYADLKRRAE